ncbi:hypothetical protein SDC9_121133 [bioreactor metagenome]|uniref:Carbohydrate-binding domain-containing protein n=1 Tax=bioreactor metagenome TaxID=1076179 RepID=A0A645CB72_9ZZZZ
MDGPVYVSYPEGAFRPAPAVAAQKRMVGASAGSTVSVPLEVRNPFRATAKVTVKDLAPVTLEPEATREIPISVTVPDGRSNGLFPLERSVRLESGDTALELTVPLAVNVGYPVAAGEKPAATIVLDTLDKVHELTFDPAIPRWKGPKDLSCVFAMTRDGGDLKLSIRVTDDRHVMNSSPADGWKDDSIQIGFQPLNGGLTELTLSGKDGKCTVYTHISPDPAARGEWSVPARLTRQGDVTHYEVSLPLAKLGISPEPGTLFRFAFLVNENDGQGRVRWIEWMGGIGRSKNPDEFGWAVLR